LTKTACITPPIVKVTNYTVDLTGGRINPESTRIYRTCF